MDARNTYYSLINKGLKISNIDDVINFKNQCRLDNNSEYFYLANLLIIDIYIEEKLYNDALNIAYRNFNDLDKVVFKDIYYSLLERYIYIYIAKKNYRTAYKYAIEKKEFIDINDKDAVNRWYLEMAYILDALNEKSKALNNLMSIIENDPIPEIRGIVLNNLTKLYIDNKDIINAKDYLEKSISYSYEIKDDEARIYCAYLQAKIYELENKNRYSAKLYSDIFRTKTEIDDEYIGYLNEYLVLLNKMNEYKEAKAISERFIKSVEKSNDLFLKRDFYKNYIKASINLNSLFNLDFKKIYAYTEILENELNKNISEMTKESNDDDTVKEVSSNLQKTTEALEKITNIINYSIISKNERDCLFEFSRQLEKIVAFNEVTFYIFNRSTFDAYPKFLESNYLVSSFQYKKERMYERSISYNDLNNTIIETLISGNHDLSIDFTDTKVDIIEPISKMSYLDLKIKTLYASPLTYESRLYGAVVFSSNNVDLLDNYNNILLKIATNMLEAKLISLFYQESLRTKTKILQEAMEALQEGLYYYDIYNNRLHLSNEMKSFLNINNNVISESEYLDLIIEKDRDIYSSRKKNIIAKEKYCIEYHLNINGIEVNILEKGSPFLDNNEKCLFYIVTINKTMSMEAIIELERRSHPIIKNKEELIDYLDNNKDNQLSLIKFKLDEFNLDIINKIHNSLYDYSYGFYYFVESLYVVSKIISDNEINNKINMFKEDVKYIIYLFYPDDHRNISNLIDIINITDSNKEIIQKNNLYHINSSDIKLFNLKLDLDNCLKDEINNINEIYYSELEYNRFNISKFIRFNINGISDFYSSIDLFKDDVLNEFEIKYLSKVNSILNDEIVIYPLSSKSLNYVIKNKSKYNLDKFYFLIDKLNDNEFILDDDLNYLIDYKLLDSINYKQLKNIKGVYIKDNINDLDLSLLNNKIIISNIELKNIDYIQLNEVIRSR